MQAEQLSEVLAREGPDFLATWRPPMLTWAELQQLKAEDAAGNALEAAQPGVRLCEILRAELRTIFCTLCTCHVGFSQRFQNALPASSVQLLPHSRLTE